MPHSGVSTVSASDIVRVTVLNWARSSVLFVTCSVPVEFLLRVFILLVRVLSVALQDALLAPLSSRARNLLVIQLLSSCALKNVICSTLLVFGYLVVLVHLVLPVQLNLLVEAVLGPSVILVKRKAAVAVLLKAILLHDNLLRFLAIMSRRQILRLLL